MSEEWTPEKIEALRANTAVCLGARLGPVRSLRPFQMLIVTKEGHSFSVFFEYEFDLVAFMCKNHDGVEFVTKVPDDESSVRDQLLYSVALWITGDSTRIDVIWEKLAHADSLPPNMASPDDVKRDIGSSIKKIDIIPPKQNYSTITTMRLTVLILK